MKRKITRDDVIIAVLCTAVFLCFVLPNIIAFFKR